MIALVMQLFGHGFALSTGGRGEVLLDFGRGLAPPQKSGSVGGSGLLLTSLLTEQRAITAP